MGGEGGALSAEMFLRGHFPLANSGVRLDTTAGGGGVDNSL